MGIEARNLDGGYRTWIAADAAREQEPLRLAKDKQELP
jgi:3-mercaptopyruvate sulfurtransferase SseA